jgi:hypothetical protein
LDSKQNSINLSANVMKCKKNGAHLAPHGCRHGHELGLECGDVSVEQRQLQPSSLRKVGQLGSNVQPAAATAAAAAKARLCNVLPESQT